MSKYVVDIHGDIEGDYEIIKEYEEPKIGHWIKVTNGRGGHECDVCHGYAPSFQNGNEHLSAFCPKCGAKMVKPQESEDKE